MRDGVTRRVLGAGAVATAVASLAQASHAATADGALDAYMAQFVRANDFAGVIQIKRGRQLLARRSYGLARPGVRNRPSSRFAIKSISKLITVGCLYRLQDSHALAFSDPLSRFLPDFPRAGEITLAMLAQHMSGLAADFSNFETGRQQPRTLEQLMPLVIAEGFAGAPGQGSVYSNNGYRVLGRVIELAGGAPYHDIANRLVLRPLGLSNTGPLFGTPVRDLSLGHVVGPAPGSLTAPLPVDFSNWQGAASFYSDASDLARNLLSTIHSARLQSLLRQTTNSATMASGTDILFKDRRRRHTRGESSACVLVREPDAGNPAVRFDERDVETESWSSR